MIILSQSKTTIVNTETIQGVHIKENAIFTEFRILANFGENAVTIGVYESLDRAKEVLNDLLSLYSEPTARFPMPKE